MSVSTRIKIACAVFLVSFLPATTTNAYAQAVYGSIYGTVTDSTQAVVPNATVVVTDVAKATTPVSKSPLRPVVDAVFALD